MNRQVGLSSAAIAIKKLSRQNGFEIAKDIWQQALARVKPDLVANIKHAELNGDSSWRLHVAEIVDKVACHVHTKGQEIYEIVAGAGLLLSSPVEKVEKDYRLCRCDELSVKTEDVFIVPEGYAHQLVKTGAGPLIIIFACPDTHLAGDRILLPDFAKIYQ